VGYVLAYSCVGILADRVFEPMLAGDGLLSGTVGRLIGVGPGRGIGLMLIISGIMFATLGVLIKRIKPIRCMRPQRETAQPQLETVQMQLEIAPCCLTEEQETDSLQKAGGEMDGMRENCRERENGREADDPGDVIENEYS